jgi:hypothetical protein
VEICTSILKMESSIFRDIMPCSVLISSLDSSSILKMEAKSPSETSDYFHRTIRRHIPSDRILHSHCYENLKSCRS